MLPKPIPVDPFIANSLLIGSGIFWTLTYLFILRRSYKDKYYGMPMLALAANLSWEFIFAFVFPHPYPQRITNFIWLSFDLGLMVQYFYYGRKDFPRNLPQSLFYQVFLLSLLFSALIIAFLSLELKEYVGYYAAFGQNLLMSVLFIQLLLKRNNVSGQSLYIALFKMIGTILASITFYLYFPGSYLLFLLYIAILTFDLIYFVFLYQKLKTAGIAPWARL
ncbi:MAG: hypothetical protein JWQ14_1986 [Adhaeribacter sp.]|nr:hypothetical protein [Adhaeribacter sp.]